MYTFRVDGWGIEVDEIELYMKFIYINLYIF